MSEARARLRSLAGLAPQPSAEPEALLHDMGERIPRGWQRMSRVERLDHIADRYLARDRAQSGMTAHSALKETGILSVWQLDRRRRREVVSSWMAGGGLDDEDTPITSRAGGGRTGREYPRQYQYDFRGFSDYSHTRRKLVPPRPEG